MHHYSAFLSVIPLCLIASSALAADVQLPLNIGAYVVKGEACSTSDETQRFTYWGGTNGFSTAATNCKIRSVRLTEDNHYIVRQRCDSLKRNKQAEETLRLTIPRRTTVRMDNTTYRYCGRPAHF